MNTSSVIDALNWRYATKAFDPSKKIPTDQWDALLRSLVLTPSSFGLQPWEFVIVEDSDVRGQLVAHSWNQRQVADASHLLVIAARTDIDHAWVDKFMSRISEVRGEAGAFAGYRDMIVGFLESMDSDAILQWAKLQTYIALGQFMTSAALLGIDTCPMEGFSAAEYDKILGFDKKGLTASVLCPAGYRSAEDKYGDLPKVRFSQDEMISII